MAAYETPRPAELRPRPGLECVSLIGMAGAGKSAIGRELAGLVAWRHQDSDLLIEADQSAKLQNISDRLGKEAFLDLEARVVLAADLYKSVLSTGGSVIYRPETVKRLASLGPIIYLKVPWGIILERINRRPARGLARNPGQTLLELYEERRLLYERAATHTIEGGNQPAAYYAGLIAALLKTLSP